MDLSKASSRIGLTLQRSHRMFYLGLFFVLFWPAFNLLILASVLLQLELFDSTLFAGIALRVFALFALSFALIQLLQHTFPLFLSEERFWPQLALHVSPIFLLSYFFGPGLRPPGLAELPQQTILPLVYIFFQIALYVVVKTLLIQRSRYLAAQLNLRQAEIYVLRSQTNPHFLFNTLNLLAVEIGRDPDVARDIVYDLADLLRDSMCAAEKEFSTLEEELRLVRLYLSLQQKRFPGRLVFAIDVDEKCLLLPVPSLLLQPIVENVTKHVVANSPGSISLRLSAKLIDQSLVITVRDNGPEVDASAFHPTGGLHIVRETLGLQYDGKAELQMKSGEDGGCVSVILPTSGTGV